VRVPQPSNCVVGMNERLRLKLSTPVANIPETYTAPPAKIMSSLDTSTTVSRSPVFRHDRVPYRGGLLGEGLIYVHTFHTRPGTGHTLF